MRIVLALILLFFQTTTGFGVDFTKLSRSEPVSTIYPATFKCYVDVSFALDAMDAYNKPLYLRISYIIGNDTLNDNLTVNGKVNTMVKQLFLDEGERLTVSVRLNNAEVEEAEGLSGSLKIVRNPDFQPSSDLGKNTFLSSIWKSDQTPLFRIPVEDSIPKFFRLKVDFNENFEFDKLHFKMKVISPKDGIIMLSKSVSVNEKTEIEHGGHSFSMDLQEIDMSQPGTYYFQLMSNMAYNRINGIEKISYDIVQE